MADENNDRTNTAPTKELSLWKVYGICLLISTIFFFLFGFNSPIYKFNSDPDYNIHVTMGNALIHGKVPYRDLFDHKGPLVYFLYGFCCLFPTPRLAMLLIEIFCMSLFFFFAFRIARKFLNTFCSLLIIPILAFIVFPSWNNITSASCIEEFCLPMLTYFLYCWIEFILEKKQWTWTRGLIIGICIGIIFWSKFIILCFVIVPMIIWGIKSFQNHQSRSFFINLLFLLIGLFIISTPILVFYGLNQAINDLCYVYFYMNIELIFNYEIFHFLEILFERFNIFFTFNPILTALLTYGLGRFIINHWKSFKTLSISFLLTFVIILLTYHGLTYYFNILIPYTILSVTEIYESIYTKIKFNNYQIRTYSILMLSCIILVIPISILPTEIKCKKDDYTPLVIANLIQNYKFKQQTSATIFCYKIHDLGLYNATNTIPNNYYFSNYIFEQNQHPEIYIGYQDSIINQTSDIVITRRDVWYTESILHENYEPITGYTKSSSFYYLQNYSNTEYILIILIRRGNLT